MTPTLNTERLALRPLVKATTRHVDWLNNREVVRFSENRHAHHTFASVQKYIWSFRDRSHIWGINVVSDSKHIGNITAQTDEHNNTAALGILIGETEWWKRGIGTEAWRAVADWMLTEEGPYVRKLEAGCMASNYAMRSLLIRNNFILEGESHNHFLLDGQPTGMVFYARFR